MAFGCQQPFCSAWPIKGWEKKQQLGVAAAGCTNGRSTRLHSPLPRRRRTHAAPAGRIGPAKECSQLAATLLALPFLLPSLIAPPPVSNPLSPRERRGPPTHCWRTDQPGDCQQIGDRPQHSQATCHKHIQQAQYQQPCRSHRPRLRIRPCGIRLTPTSFHSLHPSLHPQYTFWTM